jgi:hypothetical protein
MGTGRYLCNVYNHHDSRGFNYKWSGITSRLDGLSVEWFGFALTYVKLCDLQNPLVDHTMWYILLIQLNLGSFSLQL